MKKVICLVFIAALLVVMLGGCGHQGKGYEAVQMETKSYDAHFPDVDTNDDDLVSWEEFNNKFTDAEKDVYEALDLNKDGSVDHDEWHEFKSGSGLEMKESE